MLDRRKAILDGLASLVAARMALCRFETKPAPSIYKLDGENVFLPSRESILNSGKITVEFKKLDGSWQLVGWAEQFSVSGNE